MVKVHRVAKARKNKPEHGIEKGQPYYWWWRRPPRSKERGSKCYSLTFPKLSQLVCSPFKKTYYRCSESLEEFVMHGNLRSSSFLTLLDSLQSCIEVLLLETLDKLANLASAFPNGCPSATRVEFQQTSCEEFLAVLEEIRELVADPDVSPEMLRQEIKVRIASY